MMSISGPASYVPTINLFLPHWAQINLALGGEGPLVLTSGGTLLILTGYRDSLAVFAFSIGDLLPVYHRHKRLFSQAG
jgi:hypothetical protein